MWSYYCVAEKHCNNLLSLGMVIFLRVWSRRNQFHNSCGLHDWPVFCPDQQKSHILTVQLRRAWVQDRAYNCHTQRWASDLKKKKDEPTILITCMTKCMIQGITFLIMSIKWTNAFEPQKRRRFSAWVKSKVCTSITSSVLYFKCKVVVYRFTMIKTCHCTNTYGPGFKYFKL